MTIGDFSSDVQAWLMGLAIYNLIPGLTEEMMEDREYSSDEFKNINHIFSNLNRFDSEYVPIYVYNNLKSIYRNDLYYD